MTAVIDGTGTSTFPAVDGVTMLEGGVAMPRMVLATAQNTTSGTSIDFTGIPSWVKRITVMFNGVSTNGTSNLQIQLGDSGGVETSGYLSGASNFAAYSSSTSGLLSTHNNSAAAVWGGFIQISLFESNTWVSKGNLNDSSAGAQVISSAGSKSTSATLDRIRITTVNGTDTFDAGSVNILYEG